MLLKNQASNLSHQKIKAWNFTILPKGGTELPFLTKVVQGLKLSPKRASLLLLPREFVDPHNLVRSASKVLCVPKASLDLPDLPKPNWNRLPLTKQMFMFPIQNMRAVSNSICHKEELDILHLPKGTRNQTLLPKRAKKFPRLQKVTWELLPLMKRTSDIPPLLMGLPALLLLLPGQDSDIPLYTRNNYT